jgi:hypothetical protein
LGQFGGYLSSRFNGHVGKAESGKRKAEIGPGLTANRS